ncbi:MAG: DNA-directed RNA polymerase subunit omega [Francisellaceae bacterium]
MARVTVEDCLDVIESRFELIVLAAKRARHLMVSGEEPRVDWDNDKPTVVALREIADGKISKAELREEEDF